jgi:hypothetical protein
MKLQILAACAALVTVSAGSAFAGEPITAKLQSPVAERTKFIAGGAMFVCESDACVALAPTSQTFATAACKTVAGKVGPVVSFSGRKALDEGRLTDCNAQALARADGGAQLAKQ